LTKQSHIINPTSPEATGLVPIPAAQDVALPAYDRACHALAEAKSFADVKDVLSEAVARQAFARMSKNKQMEIDACEIRIRAERRLGELLVAQKAAGGLNPGTRLVGGGDGAGAPTTEAPAIPTLASEGIDFKMSVRAQKLAQMPNEGFDKILGEWGDDMRKGERITTDILGKHKRLENEALKRTPIVIPDGKFSVMVIDPPWQMEKIERDVAPNQVAFDYPTMNEAELIAFKDVLESMFADDCHMFMWTTQKFLPMALRLVEAYGFRYVLTMVWYKNGGFQPFGLPQYNVEFAVYARRGTPKFIDFKAFSSGNSWPRREHSRKPNEFYELIRRVTDGPRIDVFSREPREGFKQLGNEISKFPDVA
jgi:N6-adenosine-specific RNA methylase IME4